MSGPEASGGTTASEPRMRWSGFWVRCIIAVAIASVFMTSAVALVDRGFTDRVQKIRRIKIDLADPPPGGANYLIIGSDTRAFVNNAGDAASFGDPNSDEASGQRSDTIMVAHVEPSAQRTFVVSFPRDLMVNVPGTPGLSQINSAYSTRGPTGGPQLVADTLKANFDIDINHYLQVDFKSFQEIVNEIGNVYVWLPGAARDEETGLNVPYGNGCYALDGQAALAYVRARHIEIADPNGTIVDDNTGTRWRKLDDWSDLSRIKRQQSFIRRLAGLAISKALGDPLLALSLADNVIGYLKADQNLSRDDVNALVRAFRTVDVNDPNSVKFETIPVTAYPADPNRVIPSADADAVIEQLRTFGDDTPKPATVQPSQVKVRVVDATSTNVAPSVVTALNDQGFTATSGGASASKVAVSEIRYGYGQAEEAKALIPYFPDAKLVPDAQANDTVVLVLGSSFVGAITVPSTTTTAPTSSTVPGAPVTTQGPSTTKAPATTTTTDPSENCPT